MRLFKKHSTSLASAPSSWHGVFSSIMEPFSGAWQRNIEWKRESVLAYHAIFACVTLISSDISKLAIGPVKKDSDDIWSKSTDKKGDVLQGPNNFQNRIQFFEQWMISKLTRGNTYVLKGRSGGLQSPVDHLFILNPDCVLPLVTPAGDVYYQLSQDNLSGIVSESITVPASEIIHDRFNCLFHPLVGLSPIFASGLAAYQGLQIQENSGRFFKNGSRPSGVVTVPGQIAPDVADRLKTQWENGYTGENVGKTAILGDGMKYEAISTNAVDAQMVEQLRLTAEIVCSTFHVPTYKVGGQMPNYNNIEALEQQYYSQCLQKHIEDIELCLDNGLGFSTGTGVEFDLDGLLRMDSKTQVDTLTKAVSGGLDTPNEARKKRNQKPLKGGDTVYLQEQNYSIAALAERDASADPFANKSSTPPALPAPADTTNDGEDSIDGGDQADGKNFIALLSKGFDEALTA